MKKESEGGSQRVGGLPLLGGMMGRGAPVERVEGRTVVEGGVGVDVGTKEGLSMLGECCYHV